MWLNQLVTFIQNSDNYDRIGLSIIFLAVIFFTMMLVLLVRKFIVSNQEIKTESKRRIYREMISKIAQGEDFNPLTDFDQEDLIDIRNIIADTALEVKGNSFKRIQEYYIHLKLDQTDIKRLRGASTNKRLRSLNRLEKLKMTIPYELHFKLLSDNNSVIRLLAMLLFINNYKKNATPQLISFIEQKKYGQKGYLFLLIQEIGKKDKSSLSFLFERISDPEFEEALLMSASISPPVHFDDIIYQKLTKNSAPFVIVWALRVLAHYPSENLFSLINILKSHPFWAIRLEVVRTLRLFEPHSIHPMLELLMRDSNYLVRFEATLFATTQIELNKNILNHVMLDSRHPASNILAYIISSQEVKAA